MHVSRRDDLRQELWRASVQQLAAAASYRLRACARNQLGWGQASEPETLGTSEAPVPCAFEGRAATKSLRNR